MADERQNDDGKPPAHVDEQGHVKPRRSDHLDMLSKSSGAHEGLVPEEDTATTDIDPDEPAPDRVDDEGTSDTDRL